MNLFDLLEENKMKGIPEAVQQLLLEDVKKGFLRNKTHDNYSDLFIMLSFFEYLLKSSALLIGSVYLHC